MKKSDDTIKKTYVYISLIVRQPIEPTSSLNGQMSFRALGLPSSTHLVVEAADDGPEPDDGLMRLGLWGAKVKGPFPSTLYCVHGDLLKYRIQNTECSIDSYQFMCGLYPTELCRVNSDIIYAIC